MTLTEHFREVLRGGYVTGPLDTQWKVVGRVLYFQDSKGALDWAMNLLAFPMDGRPAGFQAAWLAVRDKINADVDLCVGYSRGGPFAVYAAEHFGVPFITFGCPRVGRTTATGFRCAGPRDIVTVLPPFYRHAGNRVILGSAKRGNIGLIEWLSGHGPSEYMQRLEDVCL